MNDRPERESCPNTRRCPMFSEFQNRAALRVFQHQYCYSRFERCERYKLASQGKMPDGRLLPDGDWLPQRSERPSGS
ncbi:MAG: hypothetical protein R3B07_26080 [Polyangiaceae bacterium]